MVPSALPSQNTWLIGAMIGTLGSTPMADTSQGRDSGILFLGDWRPEGTPLDDWSPAKFSWCTSPLIGTGNLGCPTSSQTPSLVDCNQGRDSVLPLPPWVIDVGTRLSFDEF